MTLDKYFVQRPIMPGEDMIQTLWTSDRPKKQKRLENVLGAAFVAVILVNSDQFSHRSLYPNQTTPARQRSPRECAWSHLCSIKMASPAQTFFSAEEDNVAQGGILLDLKRGDITQEMVESMVTAYNTEEFKPRPHTHMAQLLALEPNIVRAQGFTNTNPTHCA
ncbi:hypothetical protein BKA81DRAFT_410234 [Phyllosticta paracitricarpa]